MKTAYFPLRSSVELFQDPTSPEPVSRAKHAAVLYDKVCFEIGLFEQNIGPDGAMGVVLSPDAATEERRRLARVVHEKDSGFQVMIGMQPAFGVPAPPESMRPVIQTGLEVSYAAEWHTGVLDELESLKPPWVGWIHLPDQRLAAEGLQGGIGNLKRMLEQTAPADASRSRFHRNFIIDALSRDAVVAAWLEAAVQVTSLFEPVLPGIPGAEPDHPGVMAVTVAVPGIDQLSWEEICEFREHAGSDEARAKLRDAEERVAAEDLPDPAEFAVRVGQEVTADLFAAMSEMKGSLGKKLVKEGVNAGISLLPVVGTFASAVSASETVAESVKASRTWHAALMKLRGAATSDDP